VPALGCQRRRHRRQRFRTEQIHEVVVPLSPATRICLAAGVTDLRKGFEGLNDVVAHQFQPQGRFAELPLERQLEMIQVNVSAVTQLYLGNALATCGNGRIGFSPDISVFLCGLFRRRSLTLLL
jgi:hypothetical protein